MRVMAFLNRNVITRINYKSDLMRKFLPYLFCLLLVAQGLNGQITTPQIKANFGVDADLRSNFFDGFVVNANDDWFSNLAGTGKFVIDTTGASYITGRYISDPAYRRAPFFRGMKYPQYSVVNNKLLIDAIFIRDHHGDDSTVFASGSNKNGMSPILWSCPVSQGIPDKNDILDIMMHVRRDGPTVTDSLWMFGGVSIDNTTGNRYFDFEMYQTDIVYHRPTRTFQGFGPDAGHTSWQFDAAGNITRPGDIIFTAEFGTSGLAMLEARVWIHKDALLTTPANFNWGGQFDGDGMGATYGYASISPKTAGAFYTGLQSVNNTWAGPFSLVLQNNALATNYSAKQFMEFSVNLSKLGLDPLVTQNNACGLPFRRILVKSRASTSFTAELKDFVGPFSMFRAKAAEASADLPIFCGTTGISNICVDSPLVTSLYTWSTPNGNIVGSNVGFCITVDQPGTYIVQQQLMDSCGISFATDTVIISADTTCVILKQLLKDWSGSVFNGKAQLNWTVVNSEMLSRFQIERSIDQSKFITVATIDANSATGKYLQSDYLTGINGKNVFYRLKLIGKNGTVQYSRTLSFPVNNDPRNGLIISPNPVKQYIQLSVPAASDQEILIDFMDQSGRKVHSRKATVQKGVNSITITDLNGWSNGIYIVQVYTRESTLNSKIVLLR